MGAPQLILSGGLAAAAMMLTVPAVVECQTGISSGMVQVALVAHVAPRGSIQSVSAERETGRIGSLRDASVTVRMSANTGYRLIVRLSDASTSRIWARSVTGEFQELTPGSSVTVGWDTHWAGQCEWEVQYRIESAGDLSLPVRYELSLNPQL